MHLLILFGIIWIISKIVVYPGLNSLKNINFNAEVYQSWHIFSFKRSLIFQIFQAIDFVDIFEAKLNDLNTCVPTVVTNSFKLVLFTFYSTRLFHQCGICLWIWYYINIKWNGSSWNIRSNNVIFPFIVNNTKYWLNNFFFEAEANISDKPLYNSNNFNFHRCRNSLFYPSKFHVWKMLLIKNKIQTKQAFTEFFYSSYKTILSTILLHLIKNLFFWDKR